MRRELSEKDRQVRGVCNGDNMLELYRTKGKGGGRRKEERRNVRQEGEMELVWILRDAIDIGMVGEVGNNGERKKSERARKGKRRSRRGRRQRRGYHSSLCDLRHHPFALL